MTGIWHAMGKQPIIGGLCYVKLNGLKNSHLLNVLVHHSISKSFSYVILHILFSARL